MSKWRTTEFCENCYREWCCQGECKYHLLHRIKQTRDELSKMRKVRNVSVTDCLDALDRLIAESEDWI